MAITLQKPLGTDIYDVDVFNYNATIIEQFLNQLIIDNNISIKVYYYPETSTTFNIDTCKSGIHICDNMLYDNISGTFPDSSKTHFVVMSLGEENDYSTVQLLFDLSNSTKYKTYYRARLSGLTDWSTWTGLGSGSGGSSEGVQIIYTDEIDVDTVDTGIYVCQNATVTGVMPEDMVDKTSFQISSYGDGENYPKFQTIINFIDGKQYVRYKRKIESGEYAWTKWEEIGNEEGKYIEKVDGTGSGTTTLENLLVTGLTNLKHYLYIGDKDTANSCYFSIKADESNISSIQLLKRNNDDSSQVLIKFDVTTDDNKKVTNVRLWADSSIQQEVGFNIFRPQTEFEPILDKDIVNKKYVDDAINSIAGNVTFKLVDL